MKKFFRFLLTNVLSFAMIILMINSVNAETYTTDENLAIDKVSSIGVMVGTDNGFEGSSNLTRAQAAAIMVRLKGISEGNVENERKRGTTKFKDVSSDHWALGYINLANAYGIIKGTSDTTFNPDSNVKLAELITMAARLLNAGDMIEKNGEWPNNYMDFAKEEGLVEKTVANSLSSATRMQTAMVVAKTLEADTWKVSGVVIGGNGSSNKYAKQPGENILKNVFEIERYVDEEVETINTSKKKITFKKYSDNSKSKAPENVSSKVDLKNIKEGDNVEVWYDKDDEKIIMVSKATKGKNNVDKTQNFAYITKYQESNRKLSLKINGSTSNYYFPESSDDKYSYITGNDKHYKINDESMSLSNFLKELEKYSEDDELGRLTGRIMTNGENIISIEIGEFNKIGIVDSVEDEKIYFKDSEIIIGATTGTRVSMDEDNSIVQNFKGEVLDFEAIKEGFVLMYYYNSSDKMYHAITSNKNVTGIVTARSNKTISVDDKEYKVNFFDDYEKPDTDVDIKVYLNDKDEVIMYSTNIDVYNFLEDEEDSQGDSSSDEDDVDNDAIKEKVDCEFGIITSAVGSTSNGKKVLRLTITSDKGKKATKYVDLEKMLTLFKNKFDDKSILQESIVNNCVGQFVQYTVEDSKFILYQFGKYRYPDVKSRIINVNSAKLAKSSEKIGTYEYDEDDTVFFLVQKDQDEALNKSTTFEEIEVDELSNKKYEVSMYREDADDITHICIKQDGSTEIVNDVEGIILSSSKSDDVITVTIATKNGEKSYKMSSTSSSKNDLKAGAYIKYSLIGNVITTYKVTSPTLEDEASTSKSKIVRGRIINAYDDGIFLMHQSSEKEFYTAKNIVYLKGNISTKADDITFSSLSRTSTVPDKADASKRYSSAGGDVVYCYLVKDGEAYYAVAVIYEK